MSKAFQLQIPKPCHENWDNMSKTEKGKFCSSCQKQVMDFTTMSDRDLVAFFKKPSTGSVCGRFNNDQLNKELEIPRKRIPWLKYFFTIALPTFLASSKAVAQGEVIKTGRTDTKVKAIRENVIVKAMPTIENINPEKLKPIEINPTSLAGTVGVVFIIDSSREKPIKGKIIDENGNPVPYSTIKVKGTNVATIADLSGNFTVKTDLENPIIEVSAVGYETKDQAIHASGQTITLVEMIQLKTALVGELVITKCYKPAKPMSSITQIFKDTVFKNFKFYPNPAMSNSQITIQWKKAEAGDFEIQLMSQQGQVINNKTEAFLEKTNSIQFDIPFISSGNYFLVLINHKSGKKITEKIIIQ